MKAASFEVALVDGTTKRVALSTKANRWELLEKTIETMKWTCISGLDEKDAVVGAVERDDDEPDVEDAEFEDVNVRGDVAFYVELNRRTQRETLDEARRMFADQLKGTTEMLAQVVDVMRLQRDSYEHALKLQASVMAAASQPEDDATTNMLKMALAVGMQNPQQLMGMLGGILKPAPAPKPSPPAPKPPQRPTLKPATTVVNGVAQVTPG